ncbi:MAG: phosphoribosylanthranilate isomerase [Deltaproteobacteria bacterium]|nr:MAG: phosphoribosylanthranilate isomerase [Deltaproteobacteria bacterium]
MLVKICGLTTVDHVRAACEAGADAIGLVFAVGSVRQVTKEQAKTLLAAVSPGVLKVAVYKHYAAMDALEIADLGFDAVQAFTYEALLPDGAFALPATREDMVVRAPPGALRPEGFKGCLLVEGAQSGAGVTANWEDVQEIAEHVPVILAGGLTPENVAEAIATVRPVGVDVSSGVESTRGVKDPTLIRAFIGAVRATEGE